MNLCIRCNNEVRLKGRRVGHKCHYEDKKKWLVSKSEDYRHKFEMVTQERDRKYQKEKRLLNPLEESEENMKYKLENPEKIKAHLVLHRALRNGKICKEPCQICGNENSQAHHPNYLLPLFVKWLCPSHHKKEHLVEPIINLI